MRCFIILLLALAGCAPQTVPVGPSSVVFADPAALIAAKPVVDNIQQPSVTQISPASKGQVIVVTLLQEPSEFARQQFVRAGGVARSPTQWVLPDYDFEDVNNLVAIALRAAGNEPGGAAVTKERVP